MEDCQPEFACVWSKADLGADFSCQQSLPSFSVSITCHNTFLAGSVMKRLHLTDWLQCLSACTSAEDCISFNFYPNLGTCKLNSEGITELGRNCPKENSLVFLKVRLFSRSEVSEFLWRFIIRNVDEKSGDWSKFFPKGVNTGNKINHK